jgi:hypothetical protein
MELHSAQALSDKLLRGDLSSLGAASVIPIAGPGQLEPMDFKLMVMMTHYVQHRLQAHPLASIQHVSHRNHQVLELLVELSQSENQGDTPFGAALSEGVSVSCARLLSPLMLQAAGFVY